jgi:hypothetical protein
MSEAKLSELMSLVLVQGALTEGHVSDFRRIFFEDGKITINEADSLFEINNLKNKPDGWNTLFIEAITAFLVYQTMPEGYINQANAAWLMTRISADGVVETQTELELLLKVMKIAKNVTPELERFALDQVKYAVLHGSGYLGRGRELQQGVIGEADVETIRRVVYACSSEGGISISRAEAEAICDLNDATEGAENHESWQKLFVGAIANHLMMLAAWDEPDLQEALRREKWLEEPVRGIFIPSFSGLLKRGLSIFAPEEEITYSHMDAAATASADRVTEREASWLVERFNRDGILNTNEKALLKFLEVECPDIHTSLLPMIRAA